MKIQPYLNLQDGNNSVDASLLPDAKIQEINLIAKKVGINKKFNLVESVSKASNTKYNIINSDSACNIDLKSASLRKELPFLKNTSIDHLPSLASDGTNMQLITISLKNARKTAELCQDFVNKHCHWTGIQFHNIKNRIRKSKLIALVPHSSQKDMERVLSIIKLAIDVRKKIGDNHFASSYMGSPNMQRSAEVKISTWTQANGELNMQGKNDARKKEPEENMTHASYIKKLANNSIVQHAPNRI